MEKIRPAIIVDINEEENEVYVQKLTTKRHQYNQVFEHPKMKRTTYLTNEVVKISEYNLIRYIGNSNHRKRVRKWQKYYIKDQIVDLLDY